MSSSPSADPERQTSQENIVTFWLPQGLRNSMRVTAERINVAPPVFLRKAIELHQIHRLLGPLYINTGYPDQEQLKAVFEAFQNDEKAKEMYGIQLKTYLTEYEQAYVGQEQGRNPEYVGITTEDVTLSAADSDYVDSQVFSMDTSESYLTPQAFCIAATLELIHLYMALEVTGSDSTD